MSTLIPYRADLKLKARKNRNNPTKPESLIWYEVLCNHKIKHKFLRQKPIQNFIVDFYCFKLRLVIEIDGDSHAEQVLYDQERSQILNQHGLQVIRYTNFEIMNNLKGVFDDLLGKIRRREKELGLCLDM